MSKPLFVISSPFDTYSGYGARSRDLIKAIIETDKYDVKLLSQRWGDCAWKFCSDNQEWSFLYNYVLNTPQLPRQPEIWAQITVPNEFQTIGKYNIGITAGIETTICSPEWIEGVNRMNLTLVSSNHSKQVFENDRPGTDSTRLLAPGIQKYIDPLRKSEDNYDKENLQEYRSIQKAKADKIQAQLQASQNVLETPPVDLNPNAGNEVGVPGGFFSDSIVFQ